MCRVFLLLVTAALAVLVVDLHFGGLDQLHTGRQLVSVLSKPPITVLSAPDQLALREAGSVEVQAAPPAAPGDRIVLDTAGTYGIGYNQVSETVLDANLKATLPVSGRDYLGSYRYWARIPASATYQEGKSATFQIGIVAAMDSATPVCGDATPARADGTPWTCTYDDEFDGTSLDRRYWVPQVTRTSGFTTGTRGLYACAEDNPDTVAVTGGNLELSLVRLAKKRYCGHYKSSQYEFGQVMHFQTFSQTYGKYEIRAKLPDIEVSGVQQSFWLWPVKNTYGAWPASGEIDLAEQYSSAPGIDKPYLHYLPGVTAADTDQNVAEGHCPIDVGRFNTYGVEWEPGRITVLLNDRVCFTDDYSSATAAAQGAYSPFDKPFFLSLNQAMGAIGNQYDASTVPERVTTQIDYVRIWK
jgi:beta-glucanase (GH16 family)